MGWFDDERQVHDQVFDNGEFVPQEEHKAKFSHEAIAGGVAWEGTRLLEQHMRKEGRQIDHPEAIAIGAGLLGGVVDKVAEGWGMNEVDKMRMHHQAKEKMGDMYSDHYQRGQGADQFDPNLPPMPSGQQYGGGYGDGGYGGDRY